MGRIEDAIQKIQANSKGVARPAPPLAKVAPAAVDVQPRGRTYGGRALEVDLKALRDNGLLAPDAHQSRLAEEYRIIKRPLVDNADPNRDPPIPLGNLLLVASALAGEGKTFSCVNLCLSIAHEKDWSVVLVDGDVSKPHLTRLFSAEKEPGILDLLRDKTLSFDSLVMPTNVPGFSFMPAGTRDQHASELLSSRRMRDICEQVSAADGERLVIFDSSPLLLTTEAVILAAQLGQIAVVVRADKTPRDAVINAVEKLDRSKPVGCILNQQSAKLGSVYGYYGYGEYGT